MTMATLALFSLTLDVVAIAVTWWVLRGKLRRNHR